MDVEKVREQLRGISPLLRDMMLENLDNYKLVDQLHQLINHILVIKGCVDE